MNPFWEIKEIGACDFAVLGDPIHHSRSPLMHAAGYEALGLEYSFRAVRVPAGRLEEAVMRLREAGCRGVNVTLPLKQEAYGWALARNGFEDVLDAAPTVSANTLDLQKLTAISTDEPGFIASLDGLLPDTCLVLGAGGSAQALIIRLVRSGWQVRAWNRTITRLYQLDASWDLGLEVLDRPDPTGCSLVVNATSASLADEELPMDWGRAEAGALAYELAYGSSPFLESARAAGLRTQDGRRMLMEQGALSFEWWLGIPAPREAMLSAVS
jgi:shikimate dehydrogenase